MSMWTLYGKEYDLSRFLKRHPGGELALLLGQGRDCTRLFEQYHVLNDNHIKMMKGFGLADTTAADAFYTDIKQALQRMDDIKCSPTMCVVLSLFGGMYVWAWYGWFTGSWLACAFMPFISWLFVVNVAHDAGHFAFSNYAIVNEWAAFLSAPLFYNTPYWYLQHNISHHMNTNNVINDIDLHHTESLVRSHFKHPWLPAHKYQILTVASLNMLLTTFSENVLFPLQLLFSEGINGRFFGIVNHVLDYNRLALFVQLGCSLGMLIYPFCVFGIGKALFFALFPYTVTSIMFITVTQISHIQNVTQRQTDGWAHWTHQMIDTSLDYEQGSALWTFLTGGLNCQGLHHCVPGLSSSRFVQFYPIYRALCQKYGLVIHEAPSFWVAVGRYWTHIYRLSKQAQNTI